MRRKVTRGILILLGVAFLVIMLVLPLATVPVYILRQGWETFSAAITDVYAVKALQLTLLITGITVVVNTTFGLFAAWTINKFYFRGKQALITLTDIPFSISPVIAGLVFILVFGRIDWTNPLLEATDFKIVFAVPGTVLVTIFVTFPFVSRELVPVMQAQGNEEEETAAPMGAEGFTIFHRIIFPYIKWALLYGVILCTARSLGEFGVVSVVPGHLRDKTNTLPFHVEILFNKFHLTAAFAVSSILVLIAVVIPILRNIVKHRVKRGER